MAKPAGVAKDQQRALGELSALAGINRFYLAGGTAIAWHLGHRRSRDLDLFSLDGEVDLANLKRGLERSRIELEVVSEGEASLKVRVLGVPVDVVRYPYRLLEPPVAGPAGFPVARLTDLGAMKLAAVSTRGIYRDFWDLFEIARDQVPLTQLVMAHRRRFGLRKADAYHLARALTYFEDAERIRRFPAGLTPVRWAEIKAFFRAEAPKLLEISPKR
ncbi:MAG: nucleotidyl transferase AbiEii/AbiGii toxin family protein [Deltaproteobacteria bacterium]|nr:nucleotidyl transferase AbiEii/AbiGii toxin family protein [Deltaproteobacteria bacterium]